MRLLLHDLPEKEFKKLFPQPAKDLITISPAHSNHPCIGCFSCWAETPGYCVIRDDLQQMAEFFSKTTDVVIVSECVYGSYSPFIKNCIDRSLPYVLPYMTVRDGLVRRKGRYENQLSFSVHFYGAGITHEEETVARELVLRNVANLGAKEGVVQFYRDKAALEGVEL